MNFPPLSLIFLFILIPATVCFFVIYFSFKKIKTKWIKYVTIFLAGAFFLAWFILVGASIWSVPSVVSRPF